MDVGMPFLLENTSIADAAALCARLGLAFVELNMNFPPCGPDALDAAALRALKRAYGVYFTLHLDENLNVCDFNPAVRRAYADTALAAIDMAKRAEMPVITMHWHKGVYITLPHEKVYLYNVYAAAYARHTAEFRDVCGHALAGGGVRLAIENTGGFAAHELAALETLLQCPYIGLTLDTGHSHCAGDADMPFFARHAGRLLHMHLHDAAGKACHLPLGDGEVDLRARLALAKHADARVVLEVKTVAALAASVSKLRELL